MSLQLNLEFPPAVVLEAFLLYIELRCIQPPHNSLCTLHLMYF